MTNKRPYGVLLIVAAIILGLGTACNWSVGTNSTSGNSPATNTAAANKTEATPAAAAPKDISGDYEATGTNPGGTGNYQADLTVTPHDDVYQFSWTSGKNSYDGVGVKTDNAVAVSYTDGDNGKGCGVVLYKINADGSLDGKTGYWGVNDAETETAKRTSGTDLEGSYDISGKNPKGEDYKGTLEIKKDGDGYSLTWKAGSTFTGFGVKNGNMLAVGFGGKQCSFVSYDVKPDGTLDGKWGGQGSTSFGTEVAKKKK